MITKTILHYNILEVIGEGGMGIVYKARDLHLDRLVAIKLLSSSLSFSNDFNNRFIQEARTAAQLDHPNICTIHEFDKTAEGRYYIVMAYYPGQTLAEIIRHENTLSLEKSLSIALQVGQGLGEAHRHGIIHRDLKPANIIVSEEGKVTILDFGLAGLREEINRQSGSTMAGTIAYMAPEQIIGNGIDRRCDLWSWGVMMYQMLSGRVPFNGEREQLHLYPILKEEPPSLSSCRSDVPNEIADLVHQTLQKEPEKRPPSAKAIVEELSVVQQKYFPPAVRVEQKPGKHLLAKTSLIVIILAFTAYWIYSLLGIQSEPIRMAVMNFKGIGLTENDPWFSNGVSDDIRTRLARIEAFRIMSRQAVEDFNLDEASLSHIAENLKVDYILDGTIRRQDERIYLTAQLIHISSGEIFWSQSYNQELNEIFDLQKQIVQKIALNLKVNLSEDEKVVVGTLEKTNAVAYDYYLRGLEYFSRNKAWENDYAISAFKNAIKNDSTYAAAYAALGVAYICQAVPFTWELSWFDSALVMIEKSLQIDPACFECYLAQGRLYSNVTNYKEASFSKAALAYSKALEILPNNDVALCSMGRLMRFMGEYDKALVYLKRSLQVNPRSASSHSELGLAYFKLGNHELARNELKLATEIKPDDGAAFHGSNMLMWQEENYEGYLESLEREIERDTNNRWRYFTMGIVYKSYGDFFKANNALKKSKELAPDEPWCDWGLASVALEQERYDEALEIFKKAFDNFPHSLIIGINYSFLLARLNQTDKARQVMQILLNDSLLNNVWSCDLMIPVSEFYLGRIMEDSLKKAMEYSADKCFQERITRCYYYIGMAYLLNLRENYSKTVSDTLKAIAVFEDYVSKKPLQVGYSLARKELGDLKSAVNQNQ